MSNPTIGRRAALHRLTAVLGGVATVPLKSGLLAGCATPGGTDLAAYEFQTLSEGQQNLLAALVDQIIPETDTPGAAQAGVPQFVDLMLTDWYAPEQRDQFLSGLEAVDQRAGGFVDLEDAARTEFVTAMDAEAFAETPEAQALDEDVVGAAQAGTAAEQAEAENEVAGMQGDLGEAQDDDTAEEMELSTGEGTATVGGEASDVPFYRQLKELTLAGYYTSEAGATQELQWTTSPGRYDADVPLADIGRAWA